MTLCLAHFSKIDVHAYWPIVNVDDIACKYFHMCVEILTGWAYNLNHAPQRDFDYMLFYSCVGVNGPCTTAKGLEEKAKGENTYSDVLNYKPNSNNQTLA